MDELWKWLTGIAFTGVGVLSGVLYRLLDNKLAKVDSRLAKLHDLTMKFENDLLRSQLENINTFANKAEIQSSLERLHNKIEEANKEHAAQIDATSREMHSGFNEIKNILMNSTKRA